MISVAPSLILVVMFGVIVSLARSVASLTAPQITSFVSGSARSGTPACHSRLLVNRERIRIRGVSSRADSIRRFASKEADQQKRKKTAKKKTTKKQKWVVNPNIGPEHQQKLADAFDELAKKEGFDSSFALHADHSTFEDEFTFDDDFDKDFDEDDFDEGDDAPDRDLEDILGSGFSLDDFKETSGGEKPNVRSSSLRDEADDDFIDFGDTGNVKDDMDSRIAEAQRGLTVPKNLDLPPEALHPDALKKLGYRQELNPFSGDETPRKAQYTLTKNAMTCTACGSGFQANNMQKPGYLPPEKFEIQKKLEKIEEMQQLKQKAETREWSTEDEIEFLIQTTGKGKDADGMSGNAEDIDIGAMAEEMGLDLAKLAERRIICKRCHGLQNFGKVDDSLRPGWTDEPTMSQEKFRDLLRPISQKPAVVIALIDLFDFSGSVLRELDSIAGENPVILAANKADLLPEKMGKQRAENWVRRELEYMGVQSIANIGGSVRLVSCKTGSGVLDMIGRARRLADEMDCDVYVVGAANAGKSTLINHILSRDKGQKDKDKIRAGNRNKFKGELTTSPLPGTTLKFIKIDLGDGKSMYDTPGLLVSGTLTQLLTPEELKIVVPKKRVEPISFRVASGKCVLIGGLAKVEVIGDTKPFLFTFFVANDIKLHPTDASRSDEFVSKHAGSMLTPPLEPGPERMEQIGEFEDHVVTIDGMGWKEAAADITLAGLGWVAVTGAGSAKVKISVPKGIGIAVRPPLMPFDIWEVASKYTGGRAVRKTSKTKAGKKRSGVGRN